MILTILYDHDFLNYIGILAKYDGGEGGRRWGRRKMGSKEAVIEEEEEVGGGGE